MIFLLLSFLLLLHDGHMFFLDKIINRVTLHTHSEFTASTPAYLNYRSSNRALETVRSH